MLLARVVVRVEILERQFKVFCRRHVPRDRTQGLHEGGPPFLGSLPSVLATEYLLQLSSRVLGLLK